MKQISRNKDRGNFIMRYVKSFFHAVDGIKYVVRNEHNPIIIILAMIVVTSAGIYFKIDNSEWLFCITMFGLVFGVELINSAIEALVDLVTLEYHPLAKIAKDAASGATLVFCIAAVLGALLIFIPKIM